VGLLLLILLSSSFFRDNRGPRSPKLPEDSEPTKRFVNGRMEPTEGGPHRSLMSLLGVVLPEANP